ncbi:MAG: hypothetical protein LBS90_05285 [Oscillospiraceae bacterium]|jgi:DNA repair exonuclease SbcCD ATPase subunit|nr:hypothetical protein [Oscillospiraceae bacterium]
MDKNLTPEERARQSRNTIIYSAILLVVVAAFILLAYFMDRSGDRKLSHESALATERILNLQTENEELKAESAAQAAFLAEVQARLDALQSSGDDRDGQIAELRRQLADAEANAEAQAYINGVLAKELEEARAALAAIDN